MNAKEILEAAVGIGSDDLGELGANRVRSVIVSFDEAVRDALWLLDNPNAGIGRPGTSDDYRGRDLRRERLRVFRESYPEYSRDAVAVDVSTLNDDEPVEIYVPPIDSSENFQIGVTEHGDRVFAIHDFPEVLDRIFKPSALVVVTPGSALTDDGKKPVE